MAIVLFLQKWWKELAIAALVLFAYLYVTGLQDTIKDQATQIAVLGTNNRILKENNKLLEKTIDVSNTAIGELAKGAKDTKQAFEALDTTVKQQSKKLETRLSGILQEKMPVTCEDAMKYLVDARKELKK